MLWVKIGTQIADHPRFLSAGAAARDLWTWGMIYSGYHELDGELPMAAILASAWGYGTRANVKLADTLVSLGLWERTDTGYRILRWVEQGNETKGSISSKREAGRERKARHSERVRNAVTPSVANAFGSTSTSLSPSGYGSGSQIASGLDPVPDEAPSGVRPRVVGPDGECGALFAAWTEGIREATGIPQSGLSPSDRRELVAVANTHAGGVTGQALLDWTRATAIAFASVHDPTFGGFVPLQARKWLDGGRRDRAPPSGRHVQSAENRAWIVPKGMP